MSVENSDPNAPAPWLPASMGGAGHLLGVVVTVVAAAVLPLLRNPRFYYIDDTQAGAVGIWYETGRYLFQEHAVPFLIPSRMLEGNITIEGQWGIFNPLILLISAITYLSGNLLVVAAVAKIFALAAAGAGGYLVARSYRATPVWAFVVGVSVPFIGFTVFMDAASWVTGLFVFSGLPWVWWAARRTTLAHGSPLWPFLFGYLVISVGYVHGTLMLALLLAAVVVEAWIGRNWKAMLATVGLGVALGLVALFIYVPSLASSAVTWRSSSGIGNSNFLSPDPSVLFSSFLSTYRPSLRSFSGLGAVGSPLTYVSWTLLVALLIQWRRLQGVWREVAGIWLFWIGAAALVFGPSEIGPLRSPIRLFPYVALAMIVMTGVLASRSVLVLTKRRAIALLCVVTGAAYFALAELPSAVRSVGVGAALAGGGVIALWAAQKYRSKLIPLAASVVTILTLAMQLIAMPHPPVADWGLPPTAAAFKAIAPRDATQMFVVGDPRLLKDSWAVSTFAGGWLVAEVPTSNTYTPVGFAAFGADLCQDTYGVTCATSIDKVFAVDPTSGRTVADLLQINLIQLLAVPGVDFMREPPKGWHLESRSDQIALWRRDTPFPPVGGVSWVQPGVVVSNLSVTDTAASFRVDSVPEGGGQVVLSRLAWPGYRTTAGTLGAPLRGYLLSVQVSTADIGKTVEVSYQPPFWTACVAGVVVSFVGVISWALGLVFWRARRRMGSTSQANGNVGMAAE